MTLLFVVLLLRCKPAPTLAHLLLTFTYFHLHQDDMGGTTEEVAVAS